MNGFHSPSKGPLTSSALISELFNFVDEDPEMLYHLVIGTDSQVKRIKGHSETDFVTAIVLHRQGKGARYFWKKDRVERTPLLRERIYIETQRSLDTAHELVPEIRSLMEKRHCFLEIHIDVGEQGRTREIIREVVGMVTGNGFVAKTKPESWGAFSVADKYT